MFCVCLCVYVFCVYMYVCFVCVRGGYVHVNAGVHGGQWIHEELQLGQLQAVQIRCLEENSGPLQE